jgi:uncharacterized protein
MNSAQPHSHADLKRLFAPFCQKYKIGRLGLFGSAARGDANPSSDLDLLVEFESSVRISTDDLLEMAGEAEELAGTPVDFVLRSSLEKSPNALLRQTVFQSVIPIYGS